MSKLELSGVAYLCVLDNVDGFIGRLITGDRHQYSIQGHSHTCSDDDHIDFDLHTCCFDETSQMIDLKVFQVDEFSYSTTIQHVMKSGGDNFSLISKNVEFVTNDLVVGKAAAALAVKYISPDLAKVDCLICVGDMTINYTSEFMADINCVSCI